MHPDDNPIRATIDLTLSSVAILRHVPFDRRRLAALYIVVSGRNSSHRLRVFNDFALMQPVICVEVFCAFGHKQSVGTPDTVQSQDDIQKPGGGDKEDAEDLKYPEVRNRKTHQ